MAIKNTAVAVYAAFGEVDELDDLFVVRPRLILLQEGFVIYFFFRFCVIVMELHERLCFHLREKCFPNICVEKNWKH